MKPESKVIYEYAGFEYYVIGEGHDIQMVPVEGQHPAAAKQKHRMNAREMYLQEKK